MVSWLIPLGITILVTACPIWVHQHSKDPLYATEQMIVLVLYLIAIIVSLAAWLVWAVVT